jgi:hypothetical protein
MPVYKRAARPTAASASDDPREPHSSDNDFTVLYQRASRSRSPQTLQPPPPERVARPRLERSSPRVRPRVNQAPELAVGTRDATLRLPIELAPSLRRAPEAPRRGPSIETSRRPPPIEGPYPVRRPERPSVSPRAREQPAAPPFAEPDRQTPLEMAVPPEDPIETVVVPPALRERILRVGILFAIGGALGVGVELLVHVGEVPGLLPDPVLLSSAPLVTAAAGEATHDESPAPAPPTILEEKAPVTQVPHHHHHHSNATAAASATASATTTGAGADAGEGEDGDDVAAAVQALTKAKEELTLP